MFFRLFFIFRIFFRFKVIKCRKLVQIWTRKALMTLWSNPERKRTLTQRIRRKKNQSSSKVYVDFCGREASRIEQIEAERYENKIGDKNDSYMHVEVNNNQSDEHNFDIHVDIDTESVQLDWYWIFNVVNWAAGILWRPLTHLHPMWLVTYFISYNNSW